MEGIGAELEAWRTVLELMRQDIAQSALVYRLGDPTVYRERGRAVRLPFSELSRHAFKSEVNFRVSGRRYHKDGLLGKRFDAFYIDVGEREPSYGDVLTEDTAQVGEYKFFLKLAPAVVKNVGFFVGITQHHFSVHRRRFDLAALGVDLHRTAIGDDE